MLNGMAGSDLERSLDLQGSWGIRDLDLKDRIFGRSVEDLSDDEARGARESIDRRGMAVYCLSTCLFHEDVAVGENRFRSEHLGRIPRVLEIARILEPRFVRLLPAKLGDRDRIPDSIGGTRRAAPWLFDLYREAISRVSDAGFEATVENEVRGCLLGTPAEIVAFFAEIADRRVSFTWDVQNLWQCGTFPSLDVYRALKPLIAYLHVKGGIAHARTGELEWLSTLAEASWPVKDILTEVVRDGVSPVVCLNPPHGKRRDGFDSAAITAHDVAYLSSIVAATTEDR
jgi:sugar phosphate isomerase/epimerase